MMQIPLADMRRCIDAARNLREAYRLQVLNGSASRKSIDQLHKLVCEYLGKTVLIEELEVVKNSAGALYLAINDGSYEIYLTEGMTDNERRFALCKELFHVVIDVDEYHSVNLYSHIYDVVAKFPEPNSRPKPPTASEFLAEVAAMEFMFPYEDREHLAGNGRSPDFTNAAERYGLPQDFVELYCSPGYLGELGAFHK